MIQFEENRIDQDLKELEGKQLTVRVKDGDNDVYLLPRDGVGANKLVCADTISNYKLSDFKVRCRSYFDRSSNSVIQCTSGPSNRLILPLHA